MEKFKAFIEKNYSDYKLINISKKINVRNIANYANIINDNSNNIYFIEKRPLTVNIFRNMNYPSHRYMFLNLEKVFVLENDSIEENIPSFEEFLGINIHSNNINNLNSINNNVNSDNPTNAEINLSTD